MKQLSFWSFPVMAQKQPIKFACQRIEQPLIVKSDRKPTIITNVQKKPIDDAYKEFFASLFKIKDKDVQRRVLQAVNGQHLTCANCANKIQSNGSSSHNKCAEQSTTCTQTLAKDFEFLAKVNSSPKRNGTCTNAATANNNGECFILNKIQLGRAKRKIEPYAVKAEREKCVAPRNKTSYLRYNYEPDSILVSCLEWICLDKTY